MPIKYKNKWHSCNICCYWIDFNKLLYLKFWAVWISKFEKGLKLPTCALWLKWSEKNWQQKEVLNLWAIEWVLFKLSVLRHCSSLMLLRTEDDWQIVVEGHRGDELASNSLLSKRKTGPWIYVSLEIYRAMLWLNSVLQKGECINQKKLNVRTTSFDQTNRASRLYWSE